MTVSSVKTPYYLLLEESLPIGPAIMESLDGRKYSAMFSFSDKPMFDRFCLHSEAALRPYPLVKNFLRTQLATQEDVEKLFVVDATGPSEGSYYAVTAKSLLACHESKGQGVPIAHRLVHNCVNDSYRVDQWTSIEDIEAAGDSSDRDLDCQ